MARCTYYIPGKKNKVTNPGEMEVNEESDADSDISYILDLDMSTQNDEESSTSNNSSESEVNTDEVPELSLQCLHEEDSLNSDKDKNAAEKIKCPDVCVSKVTKDASADTPNNSSTKRFTTYIHPRSDWAGEHNFKIVVNCSESFKKSEAAIFSKSKKKLYVSKDYPFKVSVSATDVPVDSFVKVSAAFTMPEHSLIAVQRCPTHAQQDYQRGNPAYEHLIQSFSDAAFYEKTHDDNGRCMLSVSVPYEPPQDGETFTTYLFKLTCFSSCTGGINRRPFMLIFTLENKGISLGRQTLRTKVCACPVRDMRVDTEREMGQRSRSRNVSPTSSPPETSDRYTITTKDSELYHFLKEMKVLYETSAYVKHLLKKI